MEYQCFYLNPEFKLTHDEGAEGTEVLFESNNLAECCSFIYNKFKTEKRDIVVYQPSKQIYREIYQNKARNPKGQFTNR